MVMKAENLRAGDAGSLAEGGEGTADRGKVAKKPGKSGFLNKIFWLKQLRSAGIPSIFFWLF